MRKALITVFVLLTGIIALTLFNDYDVRSRGNAEGYNPDTAVLRTPDEHFAALADSPFQAHYIDIADPKLGVLRVHYIDEGPADGPIVFMLHGQATWSYSFRKMIPIISAAGYRVIAPDMIGFGRSDKPANWEDHSFQKHVAWLDSTMLALDIKDATGFLFDWGGYFGLRVATMRPDSFSRLVLVNTTMPRAQSLLAAIWVAGWRRYIYESEIFPISGMVSDMTDNELTPETLNGLDAPYPDETFKAGPRRLPLMIPATFLHPATAPNRQAWDELKNWDKPTLTLVSERLATRGFNPQDFHDQIPGTLGQAHELYPDAGFFIIEDLPEVLAEKTVEFIQQNQVSPDAG